MPRERNNADFYYQYGQDADFQNIVGGHSALFIASVNCRHWIFMSDVSSSMGNDEKTGMALTRGDVIEIYLIYKILTINNLRIKNNES